MKCTSEWLWGRVKMGRSRRKQPVCTGEKKSSVAIVELELLALWEAFLVPKEAFQRGCSDVPFGVLSRTPHPERPRAVLCRGCSPWLRRDSDSARGKKTNKKTWAPSFCCPCWCKKGAGHAVFCDASLPLSNPGALVQQEDLVLGQCLVSVGPHVVIVVIAVSLDRQTPGNEWPLLLCFGNVSCTSQLPSGGRWHYAAA